MDLVHTQTSFVVEQKWTSETSVIQSWRKETIVRIALTVVEQVSCGASLAQSPCAVSGTVFFHQNASSIDVTHAGLCEFGVLDALQTLSRLLLIHTVWIVRESNLILLPYEVTVLDACYFWWIWWWVFNHIQSWKVTLAVDQSVFGWALWAKLTSWCGNETDWRWCWNAFSSSAHVVKWTASYALAVWARVFKAIIDPHHTVSVQQCETISARSDSTVQVVLSDSFVVKSDCWEDSDPTLRSEKAAKDWKLWKWASWWAWSSWSGASWWRWAGLLLNVPDVSNKAPVICLEIGPKSITFRKSAQSFGAKTVSIIQKAIRIIKDALIVIRYQWVTTSQAKTFWVVLKTVDIPVKAQSISQHVSIIAPYTHFADCILLAALDFGVTC